MNIVRTKNRNHALFLTDGELLALGFCLVNILGESGISQYDQIARSLSSTLLSEPQLYLLRELLNQIRLENGSSNDDCCR